MGMFSWKCCKCNEAVNAGTATVALVPSKFGENLFEPSIDGYGVFAGRDIYALVYMWNVIRRMPLVANVEAWDQEVRNGGIEIACYDEQNAALKYPIKVVCGRCCNNEEDAKLLDYDKHSASPSDPNQGFGWGYETEEEQEARWAAEAEAEAEEMEHEGDGDFWESGDED